MNKSLFLMLLLTLGCFSLVHAQNGYNVGDVATDFSLQGVDGQMHSMSNYPDANGFIIIFTCNHCPYSVAYEDRIVALQAKYQHQGYQVIAINPNDPRVYPIDSYEGMKIRARQKGFNFPYLVDRDQQVFPTYGATKTPHVFLLDQDRVVRYIGSIDNSPSPGRVSQRFLENAINALIAGENPAPNRTKAIGCSIKVL